MTYDFHQLSPHDLELLVRDLLQAETGFLFESFKAGPDGGVDLRYARDGHTIVVQVKHYVKTGFAGLLRDLQAEVAKVTALRPSRYLLATSVPLSPANKDRIAALFGGAPNPTDVLGQEDLNNLLTRHQAVEQKHYKLWLASRAVLDRVLHNDLAIQAEFQVEKVHATIRRNVRGDAYPRALEILERDRVVIISGAPGVGKTTLANMLLYRHLEADWQPVIIRRDINEGQKLFQPGRQQIFYFDDFMGATYLGERAPGLAGNADRAIADFIEMVRAAPNARLILTTREHIWGQAFTVSERLRQAGLDAHKTVLRINDYGQGDRARILYNHLYFSDLPDAYKDAMLAGGFYLEVVRHPKFNPRLIEWASSFNRLRATPPGQYQTFVRRLLADPSEVWLHAYEQQLSDAGRSLLLALYSLGGETEGDRLHAAFQALHEVRTKRWALPRRPDDWASAMAEVTNAFLRPVGKTAFAVLDPSVIDLVNAVIRKAPENAVDLLLGAIDFSQIERVWSLAKIVTTGVASVMVALACGGDAVAAAIQTNVERPKRLITFTNGIMPWSWTPEARLAAVLPMASQLKTPPMLELVDRLKTAMRAHWASDWVDIGDGVAALRALETTRLARLQDSALEVELADELVASAQHGCRSHQLSELVRELDLDGPKNVTRLAALRSAFETSRKAFYAEIDECRTADEFAGLKEDLETFAGDLGVDVTDALERLQAAHEEFNDYEEQRADAMMDEYKDRYRESRDADAFVHDMFSSLRGDRS